jgi:hypothetical protein
MRFRNTKQTSRRHGDGAQRLLEPGDESDEVLLLVVVAVTPHPFFGRLLPLPNNPLLITDEILSSQKTKQFGNRQFNALLLRPDAVGDKLSFN